MDRQKLKTESKKEGSENKKQKMDFDKVLTVLEMNLQKPSTSTSSLFTKQEEMDKIEDGQEEKKLKAVLQPESENQDEMENKSLIDELPTEMLMKILKYLNIKSLSDGRLVSRKWNGITRELLKSRDDVETKFYSTKTEDGNFTIDGKTQRASLENFNKYFENSKVSPLYTRFLFKDFDPSVFDHEGWIQFISEFGENIKSLRLAINEFENFDAQLIRFVGNLRNLLLNQLPNLQELALQLPYFGRNPAFPNIPLFPTRAFHLPHLKVLYLDESSFYNYTRIVTDLLDASVNLQNVEPFDKHNLHRDVETFLRLQSLGKLHCLQDAEINLDSHLMSRIQEQFSAPMEFKLKKLDLCVSPNDTSKALSSVFLSHLFESSKDTLKDLKMTPIGFLPDPQLPKFTKLTNLTIMNIRNGEEFQVLPSGINLVQVFPVLQCLELRCAPWIFFPQNESASCLPNLKTLKIIGCETTKKDIVQISQVCPNLKEFGICRNYSGGTIKNFPEVGEAIWTRLTKLETLSLEIDMDSPANTFPAVDSCFTGFCQEYCIRLHNLIQNEKWAKKQEYHVMDAPSTSKLETGRINPSIMDLKDLRKLEVFFDLNIFPIFRPIREAMSVSEECAFKLMENLNYEMY